ECGGGSGRPAGEGVGLNHTPLQRIELAKDCVGASFLGEFEQIDVVEVGLAGNGDDSDFGVEPPKSADHFTATYTGHPHIGNDQVRTPTLIRGDPFDAILSRDDMVSLIGQRPLHKAAVESVVVDDQY